MKIYLLTQNQNTWYDTYDSCVICAENEDEAKNILPNWEPFGEDQWSAWAYTKEWITCEEIWECNNNQKKWVICASFNAG